MKSEVEIRALISDEAQAEALLLAAGFALSSPFEQHDIMHDQRDGALFRSGQKIRIRIEHGEAELTYKGIFQGDASASRRAEINVSVQPADVPGLSEMLTALGYPLLFQVRKTRKKFRKDAILATLDGWPIIGPMLELEGPEAEIKALAATCFSGIVFGNYRLKELFEKVCAEKGATLAELQADYEQGSGFSLGNISFLLS